METFWSLIALAITVFFAVTGLFFVVDKIINIYIDDKYLKNLICTTLAMVTTMILIIFTCWAGYELTLLTS